MPRPLTRYAEIQQDEIEALQSIYMEDFEEKETKTGAWNKVANRAFNIKLRNSEDPDVALVLAVSLPITYPKTVPQLSLSFGPDVPSKTQRETLSLVTTKPKILLGSEAIFEIATAIQDLLDDVPQLTKAPTLEEERAAQVATMERKKQEDLETTHDPLVRNIEDEPDAAETEEAQTLRIMIEQAKSRTDQRKAELLSKPVATEIEAEGGLRFDHAITAKDAEGCLTQFEIVNRKTKYRQGPVTKVSKVHTWDAPKHLEPSLVLKECRFAIQGTEQMYDLDQKLDRMVQLPDNLNIIKPLSFSIKRGEGDEPDPGYWHVAILIELTPMGSMQDLLETVQVLNLEVFRAWALQLLEGLMFYHRHGIIHARVHVGNCLLVKAETGNTVVKLADASYQHAMHVLKNGVSADHSAATSVNWVSPEIINGQGDKRLTASDIWDLGASFVQMLFGLKVQSSHRSPRDLIHDLELSQSLVEFLDQLFKSDHRRRPSAFELLPSEFLRNDDPILALAAPPPLSQASTPARRMSLEAPRRRRESAAIPSISRYRNDFVEAGRLGRGGYGEVVRARNKLDGRFYAIKLIKSRSTSALNDVLSEILLLSQLNSPFVVRYFNAWLESEEGHSNRRALSESSENSGNSEDDEDAEDDILIDDPSGPDFMSESGPNIVFESDSDEEAPRPKITPDHISPANRIGSIHYRYSNEKASLEEDDTEADYEKSAVTNAHASRERLASNLTSSKTTLFIQMEYCERKTLRDLIRGGIHIDQGECWRILTQILQGLAHIHASSIVHRDLKPENIFIDASSDCRIGDFGLARPGDYQGSLKARTVGEAMTSFTKSVGTAFYVAPEVRSAGMGRYNEKADMYSLGIIFFEMCTPMSLTGMERAETLRDLRGEKPILPPIFKLPEMAVQREFITSLVAHDASKRPSSLELLTNGRIPEKVEGDKWASHVLQYAQKESYRKKFLASMFPGSEREQLHPTKTTGSKQDQERPPTRSRRYDPNHPAEEQDEGFYPRVMSSELEYDTKTIFNVDSSDSILRSTVEEMIVSIFRRHGAVQIDLPVLMPFSAHYLKKLDQTVKLVDPAGHLLQLPFDFTLPYASLLARTSISPRKTYTIGNVYRATRSDGPPRRIGEAHFDIVSSGFQDLALRESEAVKVVDEIINQFPSMSSLQMCYQINHSHILNAILGFCNIHHSKWAIVKETLASLHASHMDWKKLRTALRNPAVGVAATSVEELMRFDFRDVYDKAISKLRSLLSKSEHLEPVFTHIEAVVLYLKRFNCTRKVYISPLSSVNESFYRGNLFFQCIFDTPSKEVFAAGGRYDRLIDSYSAGSKAPGGTAHAVGFHFNWDRLCNSMARFQRAAVKSKAKKRTQQQAHEITLTNRCDVLVGSSDRSILFSTGLELIQELWANEVSAELVVDAATHGQDFAYNPASENRELHRWVIHIKQDGYLKVRSIVQKEETDMRTSELLPWLRSEIRERSRTEGRSQNAKLLHQPSQQDIARTAGGGEADVRVLTAQTRGKKFNRKTVIEEAISGTRETVNSFLKGPIIAIETMDEYFDGLRNTKLSDTEGWRRFIQNTAADDRAYLREVQKLLQDASKESGARNAFVYNFRSKACIYYDLGGSL